MPINPHEMSSHDYYDLVEQMSPSELVEQRRAMRARIQDQNGRRFSSEAPYFITSFDRLKDAIDWAQINKKVDNIKLPERDRWISDEWMRRTKPKIPTRGGRR